ncbi:MAG: hypothetical protein HY033_09620 [Ignavibacteriae bacterium]|nr:hypothetical protein [Ignavibacteriota bacterium]
MKNIRILLVVLLLAIPLTNQAVDRKEGGYAGTKDQGHDEVVYNFLKHFSYEEYRWAYDFQFTSYNNHRVDAMDITVFAGHGNEWLIATTSGNVDLSIAGNTSDKGWGDYNCEFIAFESCDVVPSPLEESDWWSNWVKDGATFDGLHQALGFRTISWQSTDQDVTDYFGSCIHAGYAVWQSWFDAINHECESDEMGACVMNPTCEMDTHASFAADPSASDQSLRIWYQY